MKKQSKPDCRSCGMCCVAPFDEEAYVDLTEADVKQLPPKARRWVLRPRLFYSLLTAIEGHASYPALKTKHDRVGHCVCAALKGTVGKKVSCGIYEVRPQVCCDALEPGDKTCLGIRRRFEADQ